MEQGRNQSVLSCLHNFERRALGLNRDDPEELKKKERLNNLHCKTRCLQAQRNKLKAQIQMIKEAKAALDEGFSPDSSGGEDKAKCSQVILPLLMARHTELRDMLKAHHLIGGYDLVEVDGGRRVSLSLTTAYENTCLQTYHLELDMMRSVQIHRHDIPPCIPLASLAEENLKEDLPAFLDTLRQHVNGLASRIHQVKLVKEQLKSVTVMETNALCSVLVLMCKVPEDEDKAILFTLLYKDPTKALPTQVTLESTDKSLPDDPQWKEAKSVFFRLPPHQALSALKEDGKIV